jgi:proline racemase
MYSNMVVTKVEVVDSHTGGEPTRVVIHGGPDLGMGSVAEQFEVMKERHDSFRRAVVNEPRGTDVLVGALLVKPSDSSCVAGVIFFDNVKFIGMCGHGTIGVVATLAHLGRIGIGSHRIETPVGIVTAQLHEGGSVSITNVPSFRVAKDVELLVPEIGLIYGDVVWGGNWFYLVDQHSLELNPGNLERLTDVSWKIRLAINANGFPEVDHIILFSSLEASEVASEESEPPKLYSKNFVLCPGKAYDRSPCGTGTSARLACLAADGHLNQGDSLIQESIIGSRFRGSYSWDDKAKGSIIPTITGTAYVTAITTLLLNEADPFCYGIPCQ